MRAAQGRFACCCTAPEQEEPVGRREAQYPLLTSVVAREPAHPLRSPSNRFDNRSRRFDGHRETGTVPGRSPAGTGPSWFPPCAPRAGLVRIRE